MKRRVLQVTVVLFAFTLLAAGCGAASGTGAGSKGSAATTGKAGAAKTGQTEAVLKTSTGTAVQAEVQGLEKDLNAIQADSPVDPDAESAGF